MVKWLKTFYKVGPDIRRDNFNVWYSAGYPYTNKTIRPGIHQFNLLYQPTLINQSKYIKQNTTLKSKQKSYLQFNTYLKICYANNNILMISHENSASKKIKESKFSDYNYYTFVILSDFASRFKAKSFRSIGRFQHAKTNQMSYQ